MRNIMLPHNEQDKKIALKAMAGIKSNQGEQKQAGCHL